MNRLGKFITIAILALTPFFYISCLVDDAGVTGYDVVKTASYTVVHLQQNVNGSGYTEYEKEILDGEVDKKTTAVTKEYKGFKDRAFEQKTVSYVGNTIVQIFYDRLTYKITIDANGGIFSDETTSKTYTLRYGREPKFELPVNGEKIIVGWNKKGGKLPSVITEEVEERYTAIWGNSGDTTLPDDDDEGDSDDTTISYNVNYIKKDSNGVELEKSTIKLTGNIGEDTNAVPVVYEGYIQQNFEQVKLTKGSIIEVNIEYIRKSYVVSLVFNNGIPTMNINVEHGDKFTPHAFPVKSGYKIDSWEPPLPTNGITANSEHVAKWSVLSVVNITDIQIDKPEEFKIDVTKNNEVIRFEASSGYDDYRWFFKGKELSNKTNSEVINTNGLTKGNYSIYVIAKKNDCNYSVSGICYFEVL